MSKLNNLSDGTKKKLIIGLGVLLVILIVVFFYIRKQYNNLNYIKEDKNNFIVYTFKSTKKKEYTKDIPYVNIKKSIGKEINKDIVNFTKECYEKEMCTVTYEYDVTNKVLSLLVKKIDYDVDFGPAMSSKSYNLDLKTLKLIEDVKLLELFETNETNVEKIIEEKLESYYDEILDLEYYDERECNYECFLKYRDIDNYLDNVSYYIKEGKLYAYKSYTYYSVFGEEEYFTEDHFKFLIKES